MSQTPYRVFLSSVQKELETERVAVAGAVSSDRVLSEWCEVVLFEKEPLSGRKVVKPYLECLAGCQVCVLILDRAYGQPRVPMSATHEEYLLAHKKGIPMLIFIRGHHDADRQPETQRFFAEIKKDGHTYRRFHDRVDLIPEIKRGLARILYEAFGANISQSGMDDGSKSDKASVFEQQILTVSGDALDIDMAREWLQVGKLPAKAILNHLREKGLVRQGAEASEFKAMASGLLFLGKSPADVFPQCRVLVDAYAGTEPDPHPRDQATLSEPAPRIIEKVVDFVTRNTRHPIRVVGIHRVRLDEYPQEVIREATVNAIAHRDYEDSARPIYVKAFFDRVEVLSPGDLMRPLTIAKLIKGKFEPCSRNPMLAQYLGHLGLMEQRGSGVLRMRQAMLENGLHEPEYSFRDGYFCVTLRGAGENLKRLTVTQAAAASAGKEDGLTFRQRRIAQWLAKGESVTNRSCQKRFGISKVTAMTDLGVLVKAGLAERIGRGRSAQYLYKGDKR